MDQFFAAVEQRDNPELRGKPVAVGYDGPRGVVSTASYEARRFGVHSAQAMITAKRLCPQLIVVPGNYEKYKEVSAQIRNIFLDYTDLVEPLSLDEAFLDVTTNKRDINLAVDVAREIKQRICEEIRLTASAGISYCKFLAKVASDWRKPDGLCTIHPSRALDFIARLDIERFWGVGPKTALRMHQLGIHNGHTLRQYSRGYLTKHFGKAGNLFYDFSRGIDERPVIADYVRKSVGCEHTFAKDIVRRSDTIIELYHTVLELIDRLARANFNGHTLTLKIKFHDFAQITRSHTSEQLLQSKGDILPIAKQLLNEATAEHANRPIRLLGLTVSNPGEKGAARHEKWIELELEFKPWPIGETD